MSSPNCDSYILKIEAKALRQLKASREITMKKNKAAKIRLESLRAQAHDTVLFNKFLNLGFEANSAYELTQAACSTTA